MLAEFERKVDKDDPAQMEALKEMKEHTRRLHLARGTWEKPSTFRNWNNYGGLFDPGTKKPHEIESYRAYKEHVKGEQEPKLYLGS
mmetsp:Transcript_4825/g.12666  ORF Transcript_4825/g.12666 Transcript_4825/m.12666 type:complete len:86 (+) Transcript_4825:236-493(+)|eukprot:CAMPEP_0198235274 /NCGR_PEP_ID=MMETSP1446-20131203/1172_1 /TAXON_ID=1461542 ORGANISM="Unidentified sp, Strain CCMP2111" /NCGR_SAMPLE_ID=MMETSP1446 /ASSEMBLY_ACC=CAM_ASM_001112 /LENGTH=85 /DNA_ID=CAMNT_0043916365 /DNA_START=73 /DNA_END=330 /DNA_ORIENTATION=+